MSSKCGGCGKFQNGGAICYKCKVTFHTQCVNLTSNIPKRWLCPGCVASTPRQDNTNTPIKSQVQQESSPSPLKQEDKDDTQRILLNEIRALREDMNSFRKDFGSFREEVRSEIKDLRVQHQRFADKMDGYCERLDRQEAKLDSQEVRMEAIYKESTELKLQVSLLKRELQDRDQLSLQNDLEISGVTENKGESVFQLLGLITAKLGVKIEEQDIVNAHRVGPVHLDEDGKQKPRPIVVRVARRVVRDQVLLGARSRRGLSTADIEVGGAPRPIFINERLSKENRALFKKARSQCNHHSWKYVWTRDGSVLIRKADGQRVFRVREEREIERIIFSNK